MAVLLLLQSDAEQAKRTFVRALRYGRTLYSDDGHERFPDLQNSPVYSDILGCSSRRFCFSVEVTTPLLRNVLDLDGPNQIFSRAFLLADDIPAAAQETIAIVLFNVGLVHHLEGVRNGKSDDVRHAIVFYKQCFNLVYAMSEQQQPTVELLVFMGALCHNLAHCYRSFCQAYCVKAMEEELSQIVRWIEASQQPVCFRDYEFLLTSLFVAETMNDFRYAPAA